MQLRISKCSANVLCFALGMLLICLVPTGCVETSGTDSSFGEQLKYASAREPIDSRVEAEGTYFTTRLEIVGHKGKRMEVCIYGDNGKLLGYNYATPDYDDTIWEKFTIFVSRDRLLGMRADKGIDLYVIAPSDPNTYVGHERFSQSNLNSPDTIWDWVEFHDGVTLSSGERGMTITVSLEIDGHHGETLATYAVVTNLQMNEIDASRGGPIRLAGPVIAPNYDNSFYKSLTFEIPYSSLSQIPPNVRVKITPCIKMGEQLILGNIHFITWAGGTSDDVREKIKAAVANYQQQADLLQHQIETLQTVGGQ